jgi:hypothetical protein
MKRKTVFAAKIAFHLPMSLYVKPNAWAEEEERPLADLIYRLVKQAVTERERILSKPSLGEEIQE